MFYDYWLINLQGQFYLYLNEHQIQIDSFHLL